MLLIFFSILQQHVMLIGQCLPNICTPDDVKLILNMDPYAQKFSDNFMNATNDANRGSINAISVRRIPGEYNLWKDKLFSLVV